MFVYLGIIAFITLQGTNGQESCSTTSGARGTCVSITQCKPIFALFNKPGILARSESEALRKARCGVVGNTPKVCCPTGTQDSMVAPWLRTVPGSPDITNHRNVGLINNVKCGQITEPRLIEGSKTTVLEFPWMALIGYEVKGEGLEWRCGGTLINEKYILTAAHCVTDLPSNLKLSVVRIGEHDIAKERDCDALDGRETVCGDKHQDILISSFHFHSRYQPEEHDNDIALIRLNGLADFRRNNVKPICLPVGNDPTIRSNTATATGWGRIANGLESPDLLKATLQLVPILDCSRTYTDRTSVWNRVWITHKQLCAMGGNRTDTCKGDRGGPLQSQGTLNGLPKWIQYGVFSFGSSGCREEGLPGVYTKVDFYVDWILDTIVD